MRIEDGTYIAHDGSLIKHEESSGYYVAVSEVSQYTVVHDGELIGVWTDVETGVVYVDRVIWVKSRIRALAMGAKHHQLAIWDIANNEEIRL